MELERSGTLITIESVAELEQGDYVFVEGYGRMKYCCYSPLEVFVFYGAIREMSQVDKALIRKGYFSVINAEFAQRTKHFGSQIIGVRVLHGRQIAISREGGLELGVLMEEHIPDDHPDYLLARRALSE